MSDCLATLDPAPSLQFGDFPWRAPSFLIEIMTDHRSGYQAMMDHRLLNVEQRGWGLMQKAFDHFKGVHGFQTLFMAMAWTPDRAKPLGIVVVNRRQIKIVGHDLCGQWWCSLDVYVHGDHRRRGIARQLVSMAQSRYPWANAFHNEESANLYRTLGLQDGYAAQEMLEKEFGLGQRGLPFDLKIERNYRRALHFMGKNQASDATLMTELKALFRESLSRRRTLLFSEP